MNLSIDKEHVKKRRVIDFLSCGVSLTGEAIKFPLYLDAQRLDLSPHFCSKNLVSGFSPTKKTAGLIKHETDGT
jgi:hypothetical protein